MIRRDQLTFDGTSQLLLFRQTDHARLAAEVAQAWRYDWLSPVTLREEVLAAIEHHDDGWYAWERQPEVNPQTGAPYNFLEMPLHVGLKIWTDSITVARAIGPLAGYMVAGHFLALLRQYDTWKQSPEKCRLAEQFLNEFDARRIQWLADWQLQDASSHTVESADNATRQLRMFDVLSLYLCCGTAGSQTFAGANPSSLTIAPTGLDIFSLEPSPLASTAVQLSASARRIPARHYASAADLASQPSETVALHWTLQNA
jgi:hypothetical protein